MARKSWMIYGAYGYTGALIAELAVREGHRPLLAGRSAEKLAPLAERLGLEWIAVGLDDRVRLREALEQVDLVLHAAGPFIRTSAPMVEGCITAGTDYLDISGELPVLRHTFACDREARDETVLLVSGSGFDVIPTDALAMMLKERLPDAIELEIAVNAGANPTAGTLVSSLEVARDGGWRRRRGAMAPMPLGKGARRQRFPNGEATIVPLPIGDLVTAYRTTRIPNITTYMAMPRGAATMMRVLGPVARPLLRTRRVMRGIERLIHLFVPGPNSRELQEGRAYLWGCASNAKGERVEMWMETVEPYRFTSIAAVRAVEAALARKLVGALTPTQAFGTEMVMMIEGTKVFDELAVGGG